VFVNVLDGELIPGSAYGCFELFNSRRRVWKMSYYAFKVVPDRFNGVKIGGRGWVKEEWDVIVEEPLFRGFACMAGCTILLKEYRSKGSTHLSMKIPQHSIQDLFYVSPGIHPTTFPSWILKHN
jgi:hypothetical protein